MLLSHWLTNFFELNDLPFVKLVLEYGYEVVGTAFVPRVALGFFSFFVEDGVLVRVDCKVEGGFAVLCFCKRRIYVEFWYLSMPFDYS